MMTEPMERQFKKLFKIEDHVRVISDYDWLGNPTGRIQGTISEVKFVDGVDYEYLVHFDHPAWDLQGEGPFRAARIPSCYLELLDSN
jgi:hypothetical protein